MARTTTKKITQVAEVIEEPAVVDDLKPNNDVVDIDLTITEKKKFRINGDPQKMLELNTSDMTITSRLADAYYKLDKLTTNAQSMAGIDVEPNATEEDQLKAVAEFGKQLSAIDQEMRTIIDELFDAPVSKICAPTGSMFDVFGGQFRYEHIIDKLSALYTNNLNEEFRRMKLKIHSKTQKYIKPKR